MSESSKLPMNFGGIDELRYSGFDEARVLIFPVFYGTGIGAGASAIIDASRNLKLYEEETDTEVYKIGIHTLDEFPPRLTPDKLSQSLYEKTQKLLKTDKFICTIGGEHSISALIIRAHNEKFHDLSVFLI